MIASQIRATTGINKIFSYNECHPLCGCNKDMYHNYLVHADRSFSKNTKRISFLWLFILKEV